MARKKRQRVVKQWQRRPQGSAHYQQVYDDLLDSAAFHDLTPQAKALYLYCVRESHGSAMRENAPEGGTGDERLFYMNKALRIRHGLYAESDTRGFKRDMSALVDHGFVDCVKSGYAKREKSLFRLSSRWHQWGTPDFSMPEEYKLGHVDLFGEACPTAP